MKTLNALKVNVFTVLFTVAFCSTIAQNLPSVPDNLLATSTNKSRISSDLRTLAPMCDRSVFVWDGATPSLGWDRCGMNIGTVPLQQTNINYPDVVSFVGSGGDFVLVAYAFQGSVFLEQYSWNGTIYALLSGPVPVHAAGMGGQGHPNMDINDIGVAVITWVETSSAGDLLIAAKCFDLNNLLIPANLSPIVDVSTGVLPAGMIWSIPPFTRVRKPDVAIATYDLNTADFSVHFAYHVEAPNNQTHLFYQVEDMNVLCTGQSIPLYVDSPAYTPGPGATMSRPRIAAHWSNFGLATEESAVIVFKEETITPPTETIFSYNPLGGLNVVNNLGGIPCENDNPVITMTECNDYVVAWSYYDDNSCNLPNLPTTTARNIIANRLDMVGVPTQAVYQIVNWNFAGSTTEIIPDLSGRFSTNAHICSAHSSDGNTGIWYKLSDCGNTMAYFKRKPNEQNEEVEKEQFVKVYPNPASTQVQVQNMPPNALLRLYDVNGQLVYMSTKNQQNQLIDLNQLTAGIYMLEVTAEHFREVLKVVKRP
jgi:hypothetical protein